MHTCKLKSVLPVIVFLLCCVAECCWAQPQDDKAEAKLLWKNGDSLPGKMLSAEPDSIRWQATTLFRQPLDIDTRYLQQIEFLPARPPQADEPANGVQTDESPNESSQNEKTNYIVQTIDGMQLLGNITLLDDKRLLMSSARSGEIEVSRSRLASIQNSKNAGSWGSGRIDLDQWNANRGDKKQWKIDDRGDLVAGRQNIHLYRKQELPKSALIEVEFRWKRKLDFVFGLAIPRSGRQSDTIPRLETWDDSLVFSHGDNFEVILESFKREENRIKLLLHLDQEKKLVSIHNEQGTLMCQAELTGRKLPSDAGIFIENKTGDLTVSNLLIRESQPGFDSTKPSFQVVGKAAQNGSVASFDGRKWSMVSSPSEPSENSGSSNTQEIAADQLNNAFSINPPQTSEKSDVQIHYFDGMSISGMLDSFNGQQLKVKTNFSEPPLQLSMEGASKLVFHAPTPPAVDENQFVHELTSVAGTMRGRLETGTQPESDILCWRLPGARQLVPFANADARVILDKIRKNTTAEGSWPDTLYFFNRDVVPCRLLAINEDSIKFDSFTENKEVKPDLIKAIDLNKSNRPDQIDFDDAGWRFSANEKHKIVDQELQLSAGATVSHSSLMSTGGFELVANWKSGSYGMLEFKIFSDSKENSSVGIPQSLMFYDDNLYLQEAGINKMIAVKDRTAKISCRYADDRLTLFVDGKKFHSDKVSPGSIRGAGVSMHLSDPQNTRNLQVKLSGVRLLPSERNEPILVDPLQKELLLTIPRIKKNSPPQHILRAANADMLRGEIVSLDENRIEFRAGQDTILFPRSLVTSLIWLHFKDLPKSLSQKGSDPLRRGSEKTTILISPPKGQTPFGIGSKNAEADSVDSKTETSDVKPAETKQKKQDSNAGDTNYQTVQLLMLGDRRLTIELQAWSENRLVGSSEALGKCEIPLDQIVEMRFGTFANQAFDVPYSDWIAKLAPGPKMETGTDADSRSEMAFGSASPLIGTTVKGLSIPMMNGKSFELDQATGKVVVLDFWASWCGPCVKGLPDLIAATSEFSEDEVVFIGVNQDEDKATIEAFQKARNLDFQVGLGNEKLINRFDANSLPRTIVIDPSGKIAFVKTGYSNDQKARLKAAIDKLLDSFRPKK